MRDQSAIATKLAALAAKNDVFKDGQRIINNDVPPLVAILREIDDTVLERTLVFNIGDTVLHAVVAGRRLRGIVEISGDVPDADDVVDQVLTRDNMETVTALGDILKQLCAPVPKVTVAIHAVRPLGSSADAGLQTTTLASLWGVDLDAKPMSALSRLLSANAAQITASFHVVDGQPPQTTGDAAPLVAIWDTQVTPFRKKHKSILGKWEGPMLICLGNAVQGSPVALAISDGEKCLLRCDPDALPDLLATWNAVTGS